MNILFLDRKMGKDDHNDFSDNNNDVLSFVSHTQLSLPIPALTLTALSTYNLVNKNYFQNSHSHIHLRIHYPHHIPPPSLLLVPTILPLSTNTNNVNMHNINIYKHNNNKKGAL